MLSKCSKACTFPYHIFFAVKIFVFYKRTYHRKVGDKGPVFESPTPNEMQKSVPQYFLFLK